MLPSPKRVYVSTPAKSGKAKETLRILKSFTVQFRLTENDGVYNNMSAICGIFYFNGRKAAQETGAAMMREFCIYQADAEGTWQKDQVFLAALPITLLQSR